MEEKKDLITISNALVRAVYSLSLNEKRVLLKAAGLLDTYGEANQLLEINATECAKFYGMNEKSAYRHLSQAVDRLWDRTLVLEDGTRMRWVITCKYDTGSIFIKFHPDLDPHLLNLKEKFTRYLLSRASNFKLMYTWRLFELIMQFQSTGYLKIELDEFKKILDIPKAYNKDFGKIRAKVIEPAIKEIREKDDLKIKWNTIKSGRKVTKLEFYFPAEQQKGLHLRLSIDEQINQYVATNPETTRGKSRDEIMLKLKEEQKKAKTT